MTAAPARPLRVPPRLGTATAATAATATVILIENDMTPGPPSSTLSAMETLSPLVVTRRRRIRCQQFREALCVRRLRMTFEPTPTSTGEAQMATTKILTNSTVDEASGRWTDDEIAAMKEHAKEIKTAKRRVISAADKSAEAADVRPRSPRCRHRIGDTAEHPRPAALNAPEPDPGTQPACPRTPRTARSAFQRLPVSTICRMFGFESTKRFRRRRDVADVLCADEADGRGREALRRYRRRRPAELPDAPAMPARPATSRFGLQLKRKSRTNSAPGRTGSGPP